MYINYYPVNLWLSTKDEWINLLCTTIYPGCCNVPRYRSYTSQHFKNDQNEQTASHAYVTSWICANPSPFKHNAQWRSSSHSLQFLMPTSSRQRDVKLVYQIHELTAPPTPTWSSESIKSCQTYLILSGWCRGDQWKRRVSRSKRDSFIADDNQHTDFGRTQTNKYLCNNIQQMPLNYTQI